MEGHCLLWLQSCLLSKFGQLVHQLDLDEVQHSIEQVNLEQFDDGTYYLQLRSERQIKSRKFIIANQ